MMDMFPVNYCLSQGDKGIYTEEYFCEQELFNDIDITALNFFNSVIKENEQTSSLDTTMNIDFEELSDVLFEETVDLSSLNLSSNISSEIASQEKSYNLNSLHVDPDSKVPCLDIKSSQASCSGVVERYLSTGSEFNSSISLEKNISLCDSNEMKETLAAKKYIQMRQKNNISSQKSRKMRKQKNLDMTRKLKFLEKENEELLALAKSLEEERDALQKKLMAVFVKK